MFAIEWPRGRIMHEHSKPKPLAPTSDREVIEHQVAALMSEWNKASLVARREFLTRIDQRILTARRIRNDSRLTP